MLEIILSDLGVLQFFNGSDNLFLDQLVLVLTSGYTWAALYVALFCVVVRNNETMEQIGLVVGGALLCVLIASGISEGVVKPSVERLRPCNDLSVKYLVRVVDGMRPRGFSFFSSHAANTMSIAVYFSLLFRNRLLSVVLVMWSLLNCWTRLYLAVHYPTDILCGLLFGALVGTVVYSVCLKLYRCVSPNIKYVSTQYTSTGYDCDDIESILCVLMLTVTSAMLYAMVMTYYI